MTVLVTGAAGFIGFHTCAALLKRGETVIGVDNLNDYYTVALKEARLAELQQKPGFTFERIELAERNVFAELIARHPEINRIIHLAAQAGVRYSLVNPHAYIEANIVAQLEILETCRRMKNLRHLVFASSSSVYGGNTKLPFAITDAVDTPQSLYAATKRADELFGYCYAHLFRVPMTGLRFFTVYGPWGRPDMAMWLFAEAILAGRPIRLFNQGDMRRDFTYIDDAVAGVLAALDHPPQDGAAAPPVRLYNIGNNRPEELRQVVALLEQALGRKAAVDLQPMQPGDVAATFADITESQRDLGFQPHTGIEIGVPRFVDWYRRYHS